MRSDKAAPCTCECDKHQGPNNIDYINDHYKLFEYFEKNYISFGKYKSFYYSYIYKKKNNYCSWLKNNVKNTNDKFINFLKKYGCLHEDENFIFHDMDNDPIFLFNEKICLNKFLDKFDDIFSVFFIINFYKKNNSNIIVYYDVYNDIRFEYNKFIFFNKNRNIEIFQFVIKTVISSNFPYFEFSVNKNIPERNMIYNNLHYDFHGILKHKFYLMLDYFEHYTYIKHNKYNTIKKILRKLKLII